MLFGGHLGLKVKGGSWWWGGRYVCHLKILFPLVGGCEGEKVGRWNEWKAYVGKELSTEKPRILDVYEPKQVSDTFGCVRLMAETILTEALGRHNRDHIPPHNDTAVIPPATNTDEPARLLELGQGAFPDHRARPRQDRGLSFLCRLPSTSFSLLERPICPSATNLTPPRQGTPSHTDASYLRHDHSRRLPPRPPPRHRRFRRPHRITRHRRLLVQAFPPHR